MVVSNTKYIKVKIKWPEVTKETAYIKFRYYTALKKIVALDGRDPALLECFEWIDTGQYFPDYILLTEEDAIMYALAS